MKKEINYYVIGGQYASFNHGGARTLLGAKRLATKNMEYHDNWVGWVKPSIYKAEDCEMGSSFYGRDMYPKYGAEAVAMWNQETKRWINPREYWR